MGSCSRGYHRPMTFTTRVPGAVLTEREHIVPLDHAQPDGPTISVFTREVADPDGLDRPYLLFLQGGPGIEAARPTAPPTGWMARAVRDYRVLLLDQRGTGRSTPVGRTIPGDTRRGPGRLPDPLPGGFDRRRRGGDPARARCRALERARPELWRLHHDDLPVDRARGAARGAHHRRPGAHRPLGRRHLRRDVPPRHRHERALLRALSGRPSAGPRHPSTTRRRGRSCSTRASG